MAGRDRLRNVVRQEFVTRQRRAELPAWTADPELVRRTRLHRSDAE